MSTPNRESRASMPRRGLNWALVGVMLILAVAPVPAQAQHDQREQLQEYIERNAELLEIAYEAVRETENMPARRVLNEAANLHQRSIQFFEDNRLNAAYKQAQNCRTATRNSVRLARESRGYDERVRMMSERFADQYANLLEQARESNNKKALDYLRRSENMAHRAKEQYHQGDARLAFKMLEQAGEMMNRAARMLADAGGPERLEHKLEISGQAVERAREKLQDSADPAARKLLTESEQALDRAQGFRNQGQPGRALQMANLAQRLANRAVGLAAGGPSSEAVDRQIEGWDQRAEKVTELVAESADETAARLLERAREHRQRAFESLNQGENETALRQIKAGHDLLTQAENRVR